MTEITPTTPKQYAKPVDNKPKKPTKEEQIKVTLELEAKGRLERAKTAYKVAYESRRKYDWEWLSRDLFRRGYHFSRYSPTTNTVVLAARSVTRIPINLTAAAMRVIRNEVTAFRPKWEILPNNNTGQAKDNARYSGKLMDYVWKTSRLKKKVKETVSQELIYSVGGPWQIGWDEDIDMGDGYKGWVYIWLLDPFDFYIDPNCTDGMNFSDAEFVVKAVRKPMVQIRNNPNYNFSVAPDDLHGDNRPAASEYKQFLLQSLKFLGQTSSEDTETGILYEGWFKEHKDNKVQIRVLTWMDQSTIPLRDELTDEEEFPFVGFQGDINPLEVYGEGWSRHVIAVNRVIDSLESSQFDFNYKVAKGRIVIDKNSGVRIITNEHGSIIEKNRGAEVGTLPINPLPASVDNQIQRMRGYFEDLSGAHDVSLGRVPAGVKSGIGISELKQADASNQDDLVDNLEDSLVEVGRKVLKVMSQNITKPRLIKATGITTDTDYFAIIGQRAGTQRKNTKEVNMGTEKYPLAMISEQNQLDVQVGSWLAYTKEARDEKLMSLYDRKIVSKEDVLRHMEFGDVEGILERSRMEEILQANRGKDGNTTPDVSEEELALAENDMMVMDGTHVMVQPQDNHEVHVIVHQEALGKINDDIVQEHIAQHEALIQKSSPGAAPGATPVPGGDSNLPPPGAGGMMPPVMSDGANGPVPSAPPVGSGGPPLPPPPISGQMQ